MNDGDFRRVAASAALASGNTLCVDIEGHEVLLCRSAEGLYAVANLCTHGAARLCEGRLKGNRILCPLHGAGFDIRDGSVLSRPATTALATYEVREAGGEILLRLPRGSG